MLEFIRIATGIVIAFVLGSGVKRILSSAAPEPRRSEEIPEQVWKQLTNSDHRDSGGKWIGALERYLSLAAFWTGNQTLIAGWLAFKVASKWEVWKNIIQVPSTLEGIPALQLYGIRSQLGSWILTRFWIGTLANVLIGLVAAYLGSHSGFLWVRLIARIFSS